MNELEMFFGAWEREADNTLRLLRDLPATQYDFRPDPNGRSLGELAWHLAETEAYPTFMIETGKFTMDMKPPNLERPRQIEALAPGWGRVHREAIARVRKLKPEDLDREIAFFAGPTAIRNILWNMLLAHGIHHRGQLSLMCRLAGGTAPEIYGPSRERTATLRAEMARGA